jgi:hypothetical protein
VALPAFCLLALSHARGCELFYRCSFWWFVQMGFVTWEQARSKSSKTLPKERTLVQTGFGELKQLLLLSMVEQLLAGVNGC